MKKIATNVLDLIYPSKCQLCHDPLAGNSSLCGACHDDLLRIDHPFCSQCNHPFEGNIQAAPRCPNCQDADYHFQFARSALRSTEQNRQLIADYKYGRHQYLAPMLADLCLETYYGDARFSRLPDAALVPVPLHWWRRFRRGFNQSELLCQALKKSLNLPIANLLKRHHYTSSQTVLNRKQRLRNLKNSIVAKKQKIPYRSLIIVDDVFTTGSTSDACAIAIKKEWPKVENIVVLTAMRG